MKQIEKDIVWAKKIILNYKKYLKCYQKYCAIPIKGTENVKELFKKINYFFEVLLMVTGSGDQLLEAVLYGAKDITCFDINILAKYGCQLKVAAVMALSYDEFIYFYTRGFSYELFKKVKDYLDGDALFFWNDLFTEIDHYDIHTYLFDSKLHRTNGLVDTNFSIYSEEEYNKIKTNLKLVKITYIDTNLLVLPNNKEVQKQKYDMAYLSNIYYYLGKSEKFYSRFLLEKIVPLLKENREVFIHYLYGQGGKTHFSTSFSDILWSSYNQSTIEQLEKYMNLNKYFVANSGYGNPVGNKDVVLSLKR